MRNLEYINYNNSLPLSLSLSLSLSLYIYIYIYIKYVYNANGAVFNPTRHFYYFIQFNIYLTTHIYTMFWLSFFITSQTLHP